MVYQVYPRSFQDSDGDGVGDLRGIASRLDYIKSLGVDVVWLNPVYQSPNDDNGYDISDYRAIMPEMGSMADFGAMLDGMHRRGIKLIMDLRMDVIPFISKDTAFPPIPAEYRSNYPAYYAKGPHLHEYLREMNREVLRKYDVMTVGEGAGVTADDALKFVGDDRHELQTFFQFEIVERWGRRQGDFMYPDSSNRSLPALKDVFTRWDSVFAKSGWGTVFLGNHDQSRMVSRFGNDAPAYRNVSAKMLHTLLLTMRATPYIYNGDEIGMANIRFSDIGDYRDLMTINYYNRLKREGGDLQQFLAAQAEVSRDNSRTPIQWTADTNAGFTSGVPWIRVNPDYRSVNVAEAERDTSSVLHYLRRLIALRKSEPVLVYGTYTLLDRGNPQVFTYTRSQNGRTLMVALSFSGTRGSTVLPAGYTTGKILMNNLAGSPVRGGRLVLEPYQAVVLEVKKE